MDPPEDLHTGEQIEAAIQPAAIRHRIHMPADQKSAL